jgi:sec-independent protein translocase protein TatC
MPVDEKPSFLGHIQQFKKCLIRSIIALAVGFCIAYYFVDDLLKILILPLSNNMSGDSRLIFTGLTETFVVYLKVALVFGAIFAGPYIFYQIWVLVRPGLKQKDSIPIIIFFACSCFLFIGGMLFGYFFVFPLAFKFFLSYADEHIRALPSIKEYFSLSFKLLFAFGIVFELPVLIFFLTKIGLVSVEGFRRNRKFAILLIFIVSAFLTPDVISQFMMAIPLCLLYEVGIIVSMLSSKKRKRI